MNSEYLTLCKSDPCISDIYIPFSRAFFFSGSSDLSLSFDLDRECLDFRGVRDRERFLEFDRDRLFERERRDLDRERDRRDRDLERERRDRERETDRDFLLVSLK